MFESAYQQMHNELSLFNDSLPYTLVYENERDMSLPLEMAIQLENEDIAGVETGIVNEGEALVPLQLESYHSQFYSPRSHMEIRHSYVTKLMLRGLITQKPKRKYRHLFIFDWDDTLLCTTYLNHFKFAEMKQKDFQLLQKIDQYVCKILDECMKKGDVSIITNAAKGWVEYSSQKFLPKTSQFIRRTNVTIISARSQYAEEFPSEIKKWKVSAFQRLNSVENNHLIANIICVGDSTLQMQAGQILAASFDKSLLKAVKFRQNPRIEQLVKQQQLLHKKLQQIVNTAKNLTIRLERKIGVPVS